MKTMRGFLATLPLHKESDIFKAVKDAACEISQIKDVPIEEKLLLLNGSLLTLEDDLSVVMSKLDQYLFGEKGSKPVPKTPQTKRHIDGGGEE